jgi:hypothetical protein
MKSEGGMASLRQFMEPLQSLLLDSYDKASFTQLLLFRMDLNLAEQVVAGDNFSTVVFNLLLKASMEGWLLPLAQQAAAGRPMREEWTLLVKLMEKEEARAKAQQPAGLAALRAKAPPDKFVQLLQNHDRRQQGMKEKDPLGLGGLPQLVEQLLAFPLEDYDLPVDYHLSEFGGERLAVILALARQPQTRYLRWLSERVGAEHPYVGCRAAEALLAAARKLQLDELDAVAAAVVVALECIPVVILRAGHREALAQSLDTAAQILKVLGQVEDVIEQRNLNRV